MLAVGAVVLFVGYSLTYFGWESLAGPGVGLLDLVVPGRFKGHADRSGKSRFGGPSGDIPLDKLPGALSPSPAPGPMPGGGNLPDLHPAPSGPGVPNLRPGG